jgi:flagellar export protein FliJ
MRPFVFRLERLLALRGRSERERAGALGRALSDEQARREALRDTLTRMGRCGDQAAAAGAKVVTAGTLRALDLTIRALHAELEAAAESHRDAVDRVQGAAERFGEARRERRVVERLRERREAAWEQDASRDEQRECDTLAQRCRGTEDEPC